MLFLEGCNKTYDHAVEAGIGNFWKITGKQAIGIAVLKNGRTVSERINAVKDLKKGIGVKELCELFGISRSSYYGYIEDYPLKKARTECCLKED